MLKQSPLQEAVTIYLTCVSEEQEDKVHESIVYRMISDHSLSADDAHQMVFDAEEIIKAHQLL